MKKYKTPEWFRRDLARRQARNKKNPNFPLPPSKCSVEEHINWILALDKSQKSAKMK